MKCFFFIEGFPYHVLQAGEHSPTVGVKLGGGYEGVPVVLLRRPVVQVQVSKLCGTQY